MATPQNADISRFTSGSPSGAGSDAEIASLIARANLLKDRGQWEEAVAVCTDAVRRAPGSASAYALLGDIYFAQHKSDDALHWYRMALDRNPLHTSTLQKHDYILSAKRAAATGNFSVVTLAGNVADKTAYLLPHSVPMLATTASPSPERTTAERTLDWIDRIFPPGRSEGMTRLLFAVGTVLTLLVLFTGTLLFFLLQKSDSSEDAIYTQTPSQRQGMSVTNDPHTAAGVAVAKAASIGTTPPAQTPATPEASLMDHLRTLNNSDLTVTSAQVDATSSLVQLELALASRPGEGSGATRNRVLQASAKVAQAAFAFVPTTQRFSVRVLLQNGQKTGFPDAENAVLIFVGETSAVGLHTLSTTSPVPDYTLLSALFTNTWWANGLQFSSP